MEFSVFKTFLLYALILILCVLVRVAYLTWFRPRRLEKYLRQQGIQGWSYKFLRGDVKEMKRMSEKALSKPISLNHQIIGRVMPFFQDMVQTYGMVSLSWIKTRPRLIIADPELIRLILTDKCGHIVKPPKNPLVKLLQMGVATLEGEAWAKRRRSITPAFHYEKLKAMIPAFSTSCCDLISRWKNLSSHRGLCELDIVPEFQILTADVIARTAFGSSYEEGKKIFTLQKEQAKLVLEAYHSIYFPGLRYIPTKKNKRRYSIDLEIKTSLRNMIHKKEQAIRDGESHHVDLLSLLLKYKAQAENELTTEDVIEEYKLFYFAGQETTANWLTWTLIVLSMHPTWQEKAREEVPQICGRRIPDIDDINRLNIVSMILNEVLRLYPPATFTHRHTLKKTNIRGMTIPAGVDLVLLMLFLHHDPKYWGDDAEEFRPERFAEGISKASKDQTAFFPFGRGPRICLGQNFAAIEAKMALALILQNFWFELSPSYAHAPYTVITLQPQHGAPIILHQL